MMGLYKELPENISSVDVIIVGGKTLVFFSKVSEDIESRVRGYM
jgi:hypothetical protein